MTAGRDIAIRKAGKTGRLTLNRPGALNALTYEMATAMEAALDEWQNDPQVELVIIDAEGDRAFCAGGDIQDLYEKGKAGNFEFGRTFWADEYRLNAKIFNYPKPYVAIMDGIVMGGGVGISAHGSHRIVTERTMLAMPECSIGLVPDVGGNYPLSRAPGRIGEFMAATGTRLNGADTLYTGFADLFVPGETLDELISSLEKSGNPDELKQFATTPEPGELETLQLEIDRYFSLGSAREIVAALEASDNEWAAKQATAMRRNCPLSVACAVELVRRCRDLEYIEDILAHEYRFTWRSQSDGDFIEGIRAQIIDKDRNPSWQPPTLEALEEEKISQMLSPLGEEELSLAA